VAGFSLGEIMTAINKKLGYCIITSEFGCDEMDAFTCGHCNAIKAVKPKERAEDIGGICMLCFELLCPSCVGGGCDPFEKKLEREENRARTLRGYGIG
jgi:hypothetical protein